MEAQLETITNQANRSFSMMFNPRLSDLFFWHAHPEYELVYIEGVSGPRHVGDHVSTYEGSDLVLIGSNIPHLNFDYGVQGEYREVVVHLSKDFVEQHFTDALELVAIKRLFDKSKRGVAFSGKSVPLIGERLFNLEHLDPFQQYLQLLEILQLMAEIELVEILHEKPHQSKFNDKEQKRMRMVHAFIDENFHRKIELEEIAKICFMTKEAFCRYFKKTTKYTFIEFLNRYRISHSKRYLMTGESVSDACYNSGFQSLSYYNRVFKKITNEIPSKFRKRYLSK
ncbi:MAG: AraC family transcriptional regulator [Lewinella sp.]